MEITWKEIFLAALEIVSCHFTEVTEKTTLKFSQDSHCQISV